MEVGAACSASSLPLLCAFRRVLPLRGRLGSVIHCSALLSAAEVGAGMEGCGLERVRLVASVAWLCALFDDGDGKMPLDCFEKEERERRPASQIKGSMLWP